jgi:glycerol-3-phosphate acyltransferase PlsY
MMDASPVWIGGLILLSYLLGSIPWGLVLTRHLSSLDIRRQGSGNIGATNVRRLAGNTLGVLTLVGDAAKGALPVYLASRVTGLDPSRVELLAAAVAMAAFLGHLFPLYLKFKDGGKGVATAAGCFLVLAPLALALALVVFLAAVWLSRRASVGSLAAAASLPPAVWWTGGSAVHAACALLIAGLIFWRHGGNIRRLLTGDEPRLGDRSRKA